MSERLYNYIEITDLKDMLNKTRKLYEQKAAYKTQWLTSLTLPSPEA